MTNIVLKKLTYDIVAHLGGTAFDKAYSEINFNPYLQLEKLLKHAYMNVPYYHQAFRQAGLFQINGCSKAHFGNLSILNKELIRKNFSELKSIDYYRRNWYYNRSSGSTGVPLKFIQDRNFSKWISATRKYYYEAMLGINEYHAKKVLLWAFPRDISYVESLRTQISYALTNTKFLDCLRMTENDIERYIHSINSFKPKVIRGYASALYEVCKFAEKRKLFIHRPEVLVSSAEVLRKNVREKIESVIGTKVFDFYGSREVDGIAGECNAGNLHVFAFNNYVEIIDNKNKIVNDGEKGRVIVTNLHNYSMPLIRYEIGDIAILGPTKCSCGSPFQTLKKVIGRICCFFRKEDGTLIDDSYFMGLFNNLDSINSFRIIQEEYKKVRIILVPEKGLLKDFKHKHIDEKIQLVLGQDCKVIWDFVDELPKTASGKHMYTQSLIST